MLKDITTIKLQGANFTSPTNLSVFDPTDGNKVKTVKGTVLYGKNGSGKSTIARAFRVISGETISEISLANAMDASGSLITLGEDEKKNIFVFDEDYVNTQVKLKEDHLDTIVMLGAAVDLADKIALAEKEKDDAKLIFDTKKAAYDEYMDYNNLKSPTNRLWKIGNALRGDDAWAGRDREINVGRQNAPVRDNTYKKFVNLKPKKDRSALIMEYKELLKELETARSGSSKIEVKIPKLPDFYAQYDDTN